MVELLAAVWAGEAQRSADDVRRLQGPDKTGPGLLHALGVADAWATGVQDGYIRATLELCRQPGAAETPWVLDATLSQGWLSADRMASLALIASLQLPGTGGGESRARVALTLSDSELNGLESSLSSLMAAGRTFASITWAGSSWSVTDPGVCLAVDGCRRGRVPPARMLHGAAASRPCRTKASQLLAGWFCWRSNTSPSSWTFSPCSDSRRPRTGLQEPGQVQCGQHAQGASVSLPTRERRVARTLPTPCRWHTPRGTTSPRCSSAWRARLRGDQSSFFTTFQDAVHNNDLS